ncbi:hypothetical protein [Pyruvatibacter sp.]
MIYRRAPRPVLEASAEQYMDRELKKIERVSAAQDRALTRLKDELIAAGVVTSAQITLSND